MTSARYLSPFASCLANDTVTRRVVIESLGFGWQITVDPPMPSQHRFFASRAGAVMYSCGLAMELDANIVAANPA